MTSFVDKAVTPDKCTECSETIPEDAVAVWVSGYAYRSASYELVMCETCALALAGAIEAAIDEQVEAS